MQIPRETLSAIRNAVCAVGCLTVPQEEFAKQQASSGFKIFGTGFVIAENLVMTNRHVLLSLRQFAERERIAEDRFFLQFSYPRADGLQQGWCQFGKHGVVMNPVLDVALIGFARRPEPEFDQVRPVHFRDRLVVEVGQPVAAFGFAFGSHHLEREIDGVRRVYRFGPILQQGYISAIAPFEHSRYVERLLLDLRTSGGMSGSPVFEPNAGTVVGIHDAGREATTAFAIPLDAKTILALAAAHSDGKAGERLDVAIAAVERDTDNDEASIAVASTPGNVQR